jgi:hypothetical protein
MDVYTDPVGEAHPERRRNAKLRGIFPEVAEKLQRSFHERIDWAGSSLDFLALRLVHEHYPALTADEVRCLVTAVGRRINPKGRIEGLTA